MPDGDGDLSGRALHPLHQAGRLRPAAGALTLGPATFGKRTCDFLLGGKLVCMASEPVCVLGQIVGREHTSYGKSGYNGIDNDFSFNLLLAPYAPADFRRYAVPSVNRWIIRNDVAKHAPQGDLLRDVAGRLTGLVPLEPAAESPLDGYGVLWHFPDGGGTPGPAPDPAEKRQNNLSKLAPVSETAGGRSPVSPSRCRSCTASARARGSGPSATRCGPSWTSSPARSPARPGRPRPRCATRRSAGSPSSAAPCAR